MWFNKKNQQVAPKEEKHSNSIFSTDWEPSKKTTLNDKLAISFQVPIESVRAVKPDGTFDEQYQDLTQAKYMNSRYAGITEVQYGWYAGQGFIGWQACVVLSQNWLIDKANTMPALDATRNGYEITSNDGTDIEPDVLAYIQKQDKKFKINQNCVEFIRMGRLFGIRIALFEVVSDDPEYYEKPFNPDGIKPWSYKGISQIDPYWVAPILDNEAAANPASQHFYDPTWWVINGIKYHRTHLIIWRNSEVPDLLKPSYLYGGIPIPQKIAERVYASERIANEAPLLAISKRLTTLKVDMTQVAPDQEAFLAKMRIWTDFMNNYGVKVIGEGEEVQQFDTSLADLDAVIMTQYQLVAAASEVPATKLLGTSPKGFNATGEFEEASYHEMLESLQEHALSPLLERHHLLLIRSHVLPRFNGAKNMSIEANWLPVDSPTAAELAEINNKKSQTDATLSAAGALSGTDIRSRLIVDKDSGYNGIAADKDVVESDIND